MDDTFENVLEGLRSTGASTSTRQLAELLARHGAEEGKLIADYQQLVDDSTNESVRYLVTLIAEDERRHHRLLGEMVTALVWGGIPGAPQAATPRLDGHIDRRLLPQTRRLREWEERDHAELRRLRRRLRPFKDTTVWRLIVDLMLLDTKKHVTILRFLEQHRDPA